MKKTKIEEIGALANALGRILEDASGEHELASTKHAQLAYNIAYELKILDRRVSVLKGIAKAAASSTRDAERELFEL